MNSALLPLRMSPTDYENRQHSKGKQDGEGVPACNCLLLWCHQSIVSCSLLLYLHYPLSWPPSTLYRGLPSIISFTSIVQKSALFPRMVYLTNGQ